MTSHLLSLKCYLSAKDNLAVPAARYADLEALIGMFDLLESDGSPTRAFPPPFTFRTRPPKLLIVEDENDLALLTKESLARSGYPEKEILIFPSGEESIAYASEHPVGIALIDIKLSNRHSVRDIYISGMQVIQAIKETSPGAKLILTSGFGTYEMACKALLELGASYYLGKPFRTADILRIVHWAVENLLGPGALEDRPPPQPMALLQKNLGQVLVVDDDPSVAESTVFSLSALGYQAKATGSGAEALALLKTLPCDAVLLDIKMPDMDGLEVLRRIRQQVRHPAVIMLTAVENSDIAQKAMKLGAYDFLQKPCDISILQLTLEYALAQRQVEASQHSKL